MRLWASILVSLLGCGGQQASGPLAGTSDGVDASNVDASAGDDEVPDDPALDGGSWPDDAADDEADALSLSPGDAGVRDACTKALAPGDLAIVELMIASVAGSGDHGEWLEVRSTLDCAIDLRGLHGDCPLAGRVNSFDVIDELWIPPGGSFLVVDSSSPVIDHELPGMYVAWSNEPGDVLRNLGSTVTLRMNGTLIDSVTYPSMKLTVGASVAFPSDCPPSTRADWSRWQTSKSSWFPGFFGTPNGPNVDVACR